MVFFLVWLACSGSKLKPDGESNMSLGVFSIANTSGLQGLGSLLLSV